MKKITPYLLFSVFMLRPLIGNQEGASNSENVLSRNVVDTLNIGLNDTVSIGFSPGDIMMEVFNAPGDLTLNGIGVNVLGWNTDGTSPNLKVEVYRPGSGGYPFTSTGSMYSIGDTTQNGWIGYAHTADNDSIAYPDTSSATNLVWNNFSTGIGICSAELEIADGQPVLGTKVLPVSPTDVTIQRPSDGSAGVYFVDFTSDGGAQFVKDELIAVVVTYLPDDAGDPANDATKIILNASDASYFYPSPGLTYYASDCSGPSGENGWHIMPNAWKFQYVVDIFGDIPPEIEIYHVGVTSTDGLPDPIPSWTEIKVFATVNDQNPSGGSDGVEIAILNWQVNSLTASTTSEAMTMLYNLVIQEYVYTADIQGYTNGITIYWWVSAEDVEENISTTPKQSYLVGTLATEDEANPKGFELIGNYPNPFNPVTNISYSMDNVSDVSITVYDIRGKVVKNLFMGKVTPGQHSVSWNGTNDLAQPLPSGIYLYRLQSNESIFTSKMMLLK